MKSEPKIPDHFIFERIEAPDDFASRVMAQIETRKEGGFSSLPSVSRVIFLSVTLMIYASIGAFIGLQGHKNESPDNSDPKKKALLELREVHHLDPVSNFDNILNPF